MNNEECQCEIFEGDGWCPVHGNVMNESPKIATLLKKEDAWDRTRAFPVDPNFRWVCMDTRVMRPCEMATSHLFNSIKMIWNNKVPIAWRIQPFTEYKGVKKWGTKETKYAVLNLMNELANRSDLTPGMISALQKMWSHFPEFKLLKDT